MKKHVVLSSIAIMILPGCMVGPKPKKPHRIIPTSFNHSKQTDTTPALNNWWQQCNDEYLSYLLEDGIKNNYQLLQACEKIEEARARYRINAAQLFPTVDMVGTVQKVQLSDTIFTSAANKTSDASLFQLGFDALWELDFWGRIRHIKNATFAEFEAQIEQMHATKVIVLSEIARTYLDIRAAEAEVAIMQKIIKQYKALISLYNSRFSAGLSSGFPILDAQQELDEATLLLINLENKQQQALYALAILVGKNPEDFSVPQQKSTLLTLQPAFPATGIPSELLRRRPDIRKAEHMVVATTERVGAAIADWFPRFSLIGGVGLESQKGSDWFSNDSLSWSFGPSMRWPIISFGRIKFHIQTQQSVERQALLAYQEAVIIALKEVEQALVAYIKNEDGVTVRTQQYQTLYQKKKLMSAAQKAGLKNELDVIITHLELLFAKQHLIQQQHARTTSFIAVYKALGGGW